MVENSSGTNLSYREDIVGMEDGTSLQDDSKYYDDDGHVKRTGINECILYALYISCVLDLVI
jgi:hypothetical protein